jgi:hypothetical protein
VANTGRISQNWQCSGLTWAQAEAGVAKFVNFQRLRFFTEYVASVPVTTVLSYQPKINTLDVLSPSIAGEFKLKGYEIAARQRALADGRKHEANMQRQLTSRQPPF